MGMSKIQHSQKKKKKENNARLLTLATFGVRRATQDPGLTVDIRYVCYTASFFFFASRLLPPGKQRTPFRGGIVFSTYFAKTPHIRSANMIGRSVG